jgi:homospermidine synthase
MVSFNKKILFVGYGAVAQCTLPILEKLVDVPLKNITVMDFVDQREMLRPWIAKGVTFVKAKVERHNMADILNKYVGAGDLVIDLAWNIDCCELLQWAHDRGVLYINTSVEVWDPYEGAANKHPTTRTLYYRHMNVRKLIASWDGDGKAGSTAVLEHGANPGLISHFTKQGLLDIAKRSLKDGKIKGKAAKEIEKLVADRVFNELAWKLGVKVIHCSERDTQISNVPKQVDEFVNTWSIEGFREEGTTTAEMGWGTHEKTLPAFAYEHKSGPKNQICLARMGINTWVRSWVPNYTINGMVVRHGESFTISDHLTVWKNGKAVYRPTVHYAYCPADAAIISLNELRGYDYELQPNLRIMNDEITGGSDILGALLMGHSYNAWWTGSDLSIEESRRLVPHQNATTMQVAISVVAASMWMMQNPTKGVVVPDQIPHEFILKAAKPYLGKFISTPADWTPLKDYKNAFEGFNKADLDKKDPWQFKNFLIADGK